GEARDGPAEREGAGVPHKDLGGRGVPPEEAEAGADERRTDEGQVAGVAHLVARGPRGARVGEELAVLVRLPHRDDRVRGEDHRRGAGREAVEPVGEVDRVGPRGDEEVRPEDEEDEAEDRPGEGEVDPRVPDHRDVRRARGAEVLVGELQGEDGEGDADERLADDLPPGAQPEGPLPTDLDVVVGEAGDAEPDDEEEEEQARGVRGPARGEVGDGVADDGGEDDDDAAHRRRPALGVVRRRAVLADELAVVPLDEEADEQRCAEQGDDEGGGPCDEDGHHAASPPGSVTSRSARRHTPEPLEPLRSTRSPSRSSPSRRAAASSTSAGLWTSGPRPAPRRTSAPVAPGATRTSKPSSAASRPASSWARSVSSPSSSISPTTATRRRAGIAAAARRAAAMESGLALYASSRTTTPSGRWVTAMRWALTRSAVLRPCATAPASRPRARAAPATARALETWCSPWRASRTSWRARAPEAFVWRTKRGRAWSSRVTSLARTSASSPRPKKVTGPGAAAAIARTRRSSPLSTAVPPGRRPATISALARATASIEPNPPMWACPTTSTTATSRG